MKKELIICIIVVIAVIIGNVITQGYTEKCVETTNSGLLELKGELGKKEKNEQEIQSKIDEIKKDWDEMQEKLAYYIEHDELEKVETQLYLLKGEVETKLYDDAIPETEKCIFILEHIKDKNALNIKNIF